MLCAIFGLRGSDSLDEVLDALASDADLRPMRYVSGMYPWLAVVGKELMAVKSTPLTEYLYTSPDALFLVKDSVRMGQSSVFVAGATDAMRASGFLDTPGRGLFNSPIFPDGNRMSVTAIQINTCFQQQQHSG